MKGRESSTLTSEYPPRDPHLVHEHHASLPLRIQHVPRLHIPRHTAQAVAPKSSQALKSRNEQGAAALFMESAHSSSSFSFLHHNNAIHSSQTTIRGRFSLASNDTPSSAPSGPSSRQSPSSPRSTEQSLICLSPDHTKHGNNSHQGCPGGLRPRYSNGKALKVARFSLASLLNFNRVGSINNHTLQHDFMDWPTTNDLEPRLPAATVSAESRKNTTLNKRPVPASPPHHLLSPVQHSLESWTPPVHQRPPNSAFFEQRYTDLHRPLGMVTRDCKQIDPGPILGVRAPLYAHGCALYDVPFYGIETVNTATSRHKLPARTDSSSERLKEEGSQTTAVRSNDHSSLTDHREHIWAIAHEDEYGLEPNTGENENTCEGPLPLRGRYKRVHRWVTIQPTLVSKSASGAGSGSDVSEPGSYSGSGQKNGATGTGDALMNESRHPTHLQQHRHNGKVPISQGVYGPDSFTESLENSKCQREPLDRHRRYMAVVNRQWRNCLCFLIFLAVVMVIPLVMVRKSQSTQSRGGGAVSVFDGPDREANGTRVPPQIGSTTSARGSRTEVAPMGSVATDNQTKKSTTQETTSAILTRTSAPTLFSPTTSRSTEQTNQLTAQPKQQTFTQAQATSPALT